MDLQLCQGPGLYSELGVILSVLLRKPAIRPLRDFPELTSLPVTIAIQNEKL